MALLPDDHRVLYQAFLDQAAQDASLTPWLAKLPEQLESSCNFGMRHCRDWAAIGEIEQVDVSRNAS